jgi:hypothetical protein
MKLYVDGLYFLTGKVAVTATFPGTRAEDVETLSVKEKEAYQSGSVPDVIQEELNEAIQSVF